MDSLNSLMQTEVYDSRTLADLVTLEFLVQVLGSVLAAVVILLAGFIVAGWVKRRIVQLGDSNAKLDVTLFHFLGNFARYVILAFAVLFVLNTFGVKTTSIVAAIGAAGLAIGLAMQGRAVECGGWRDDRPVPPVQAGRFHRSGRRDGHGA